MTGLETLALLAGTAAIGLLAARFAAHRGVSVMLPVGICLFLALAATLVRLAIGPDADLAMGITVGLTLGAALYFRWDHWQDARRLRLEREVNEVLKDMVVTGPEPRDPRDLQPGEPAMRVMPRAMERAIKRQERRGQR